MTAEYTLQGCLQNILEALGGDSGAVPPADTADTLNWYLSEIQSAISGETIPESPDDVYDNLNWRLSSIYAALSGESITAPLSEDRLEWWFQKLHEFYTGSAGVTAPNPCPRLDVLYWWMNQLLDDICNAGSVPWRFDLRGGELILSGDSLPSSFALSADGELTAEDSELPAGFSNWRVVNGQIIADE